MDILSKALSSLRADGGGDFVDHLNYQYTVTVLITGAAIISAKQYVGQPIQCWVPAQFTKAMEQYAESYCWIQNTYFVPLPSAIPEGRDERLGSQISYYQWVPFILLGQAVLFYAPCLFWKFSRNLSGINMDVVCQMANDVQCSDVRVREKVLVNLVNYVESTLLHLQQRRSTKSSNYRGGSGGYSKMTLWYGCRKRAPPYAYLFTKFLYLLNALCQLFMLNYIMSNPTDNLYGLTMLRNLINGIDWQSTGAFPRTTLCDFDVRVLGNLHRYTIQCVLMINLFNEKMFIFLWFWLLFVVSASLLSALLCAWQLLTSPARKFYVRRLLLDDHFYLIRYPSPLFDAFVERQLGANGVLILRLVESHVGVVTTSRAASEMWCNFLDQLHQLDERRKRKHPPSDADNDPTTKATVFYEDEEAGSSSYKRPPNKFC